MKTMSDSETTVLVEQSGAVLTITLSRPAVLNAISPQMLEELGNALATAANDSGVRVVVLTGAGRAFSAGVDLKALGNRTLTGGMVGDILDVPARSVIDHLTTMPKIVVAKVNGHCFTGALELVLACDLVIAAEEASFGDTHARFGLRPTWGMSQRLVRTVGIARARELSYTARRFSGAEAAQWGLVTRAVPLAELDAATAEVTEALLSNSAGSLAAYKDLYRQALDGGLADGLAYEAATAFEILDTEERIASFR
jgi:enoyl-CoA hydratase